MELFLRFSLILIIIFITDCQADNHDDEEIDIRFGSERSSDTRVCPLTKDKITEQASQGVTVDMIIKMKDIPEGGETSGLDTCVIRGPNSKKYKIGPGLSYNNGRIKCLCDVPGRVVPPNQCGVHFDGFYPEQFGEWEIWTSTMSKKSKGKTVSIETVEGPCEDLIDSATDSNLETPGGNDDYVGDGQDGTEDGPEDTKEGHDDTEEGQYKAYINYSDDGEESTELGKTGGSSDERCCIDNSWIHDGSFIEWCKEFFPNQAIFLDNTSPLLFNWVNFKFSFQIRQPSKMLKGRAYHSVQKDEIVLTLNLTKPTTMFASIHLGGDTWAIEKCKKSHVLKKLNVNSLPNELNPIFGDAESIEERVGSYHGPNSPTPQRFKRPEEDNLSGESRYESELATYSVKMYYTNAVLDNTPNIEGFIDHLFTELNAGYKNSFIPLRVKKHCTEKVEWTEYHNDVKHIWDILYHFGDINDRHFEELRNSADIAHLLVNDVNNSISCGMVLSPGVDKKKQIGLSVKPCAYKYSLAHVLAQHFGAYRNQKVNYDKPFFEYGQGYLMKGNLRTIMAIDWTSGKHAQRVNFYSNPRLDHPVGGQMGDWKTAYNSMVIQEQMGNVSSVGDETGVCQRKIQDTRVVNGDDEEPAKPNEKVVNPTGEPTGTNGQDYQVNLMDTLIGKDYDGTKKSKHQTRVILSPQPDCYDDSMALDTDVCCQPYGKDLSSCSIIGMCWGSINRYTYKYNKKTHMWGCERFRCCYTNDHKDGCETIGNVFATKSSCINSCGNSD